MRPVLYLSALLLALLATYPADTAPPRGRIGLLPGEDAPHAVFSPLDAAEAPFPWGITKIACPKAWETTKGKGVKVAVLDTGCDLEHPDLAAGVLTSRDFTGSPSGASDVHGHGTHCAGSIGARGGDRGGIWGVAPECTFIIAKVLNDRGSGSDRGIASAIDWAIAQGADVISMSLGSDQPSGEIEDACKRAYDAGVLVVAAAGNAGPNQGTIGYPGGFAQCVCIAATDANDIVANFSSRGEQNFCAGPGVQVRSTFPGGRYATMSGTSMATPHVAGCAALWIASHPDVARKDRNVAFRLAVRAAVLDLGPVGHDNSYGYGRVQADKLVAGGTVTPPPVTPKTFTVTEADLTPDALNRYRLVFPTGKFKLEIQP